MLVNLTFLNTVTALMRPREGLGETSWKVAQDLNEIRTKWVIA